MKNKIPQLAQDELFELLLRYGIDLTLELRVALVRPLASYLYLHHPDIHAPMRTAAEIMGFASYDAYKMHIARARNKK